MQRALEKLKKTLPRPAPTTSSPEVHRAKEPPVFDGESTKFKKWAFVMDLTLRTLKFTNSGVAVDYAAGYLSGNA